MALNCTVSGCEREAVARGYCSAHYQRFRRHGDVLEQRRGPDPKYEDRSWGYEGSPTVTFRSSPETKAWIQENGGATWLRDLLEHLRKKGCLTIQDRESFFRHVQNLVKGAIKETKAAHGDVAEHAGSVGKRVASQLWAELHPEERKGDKTA